MPFLNADLARGLPFAGRANVLIRKHTSLYICAGTAPGDAGLALAYSSGGSIVHQLESLILAQNERWRHA